MVHIFKARLIPPWFNISAVIDDGESVCLASTWLFGLKPLAEALTAAGFKVEVHATWVFSGLRGIQIVRGAREPGTGVRTRLGPTFSERVLFSPPALVVGWLAFGAVIAVFWLEDGTTALILAVPLIVIVAGMNLWWDWTFSRVRREYQRKPGE